MEKRLDISPGLAAKVAFLSQPESYPTGPQRVETVETHMSWVFLTDCHAYKLKKPVRYDYLDFSTLAARHRDCVEEVRLNRRLAANVYYSIVPLTVDPQGTMELGGNGAIIDWLVKMRRLPATRMLDYAIAHGTVHETDMRHIGALLARFYTQAPPVAITPATYRRCLAESVHATYGELVLPVYALPRALVESVHTAQGEFLQRFPELFDRRVDAGRIIEAHGDLRPEHICLEDEPVIIDCMEFNRDLRILDTVSELAFLALECERLGAPRVGDLILETYSEATGDRPPKRLLAFYKSYHASMRAKIAVWHLKEPNRQDAAKWKVAPLSLPTQSQWTHKALHYLRLASRLTPLTGRG